MHFCYLRTPSSLVFLELGIPEELCLELDQLKYS